MAEQEFRSVFISHADADRECADQFGEWLTASFTDLVRVFWSSRASSVPMGSQWWIEIMDAISDCSIGLVLVTENSLPRPWINYEIGALAALKKPIVPVCFGAVRLETLPDLLRQWQACTYETPSHRARLLRAISDRAKLPSRFADKVVEQSANAPDILAPRRAAPPLRTENSHALSSLFPAVDRWTTIVYTCRSTFTGEPCPSAVAAVGMRHVASIHVPVDELRTVSLALSSLVPRDARRQEDDVVQTVVCSKVAEEMLSAPHLHPEGSPHLLNRDLILVGENNFSNLVHHFLDPYLPWRKAIRFVTTSQTTPGRPSVRVQLTPSEFESAEMTQISTIEQGGGMISVFPSPFNLHQRVLSLYGCHRAGQYALENWLSGQQIKEVAESFATHSPAESPEKLAVQVAINSPQHRFNRENVDPGSSGGAVPNMSAGGQLFWAMKLGATKNRRGIEPNADCTKRDEMYDISLVSRIDASDARTITATVPSEVRGDYLYWEGEECDIGLHVTLFEFLTHTRPTEQFLRRLEAFAEVLGDTLEDSDLRPGAMPERSRIRGVELTRDALVSYVDILSENRNDSNWLTELRAWCENAGRRAVERLGEDREILNRFRIPYPPHVTICRFSAKPNASIHQLLEELVNEKRHMRLTPMSSSTLELLVSRRQPYRDITVQRQFRL